LKVEDNSNLNSPSIQTFARIEELGPQEKVSSIFLYGGGTFANFGEIKNFGPFFRIAVP
jgi:hypothetical protein